MENVYKVAQSIVNCANDYDIEVTNLKLQKLLYYVQGFSFQLFGKPAFKEDFVAWQYGLAIPELYHDYRSEYNIFPIRGKERVLENLSCELQELIKAVVKHYGKINTLDLCEITKKEKPWKKNYLPWSKEIIPKEDIKNSFVD